MWLERKERVNETRLATNDFGISISDEGRLALLESGQLETSEPSTAEIAEGKKKKGKKDDERDDIAVRTRLANVTVMQALGSSGGPKYSWMAEATPAAAASSSTPAGGTNTPTAETPTAAPSAVRMKEGGAGGFALPRPAVRKKQLATRTVSLADLLFTLRHESVRAAKWGRMRRTWIARWAF